MKIFISLLLLTSCVYVAVGVKFNNPDCMKVCKPSEPLCIHIKQPTQKEYPYKFMTKCELERFNCDGGLGKVVPMKMCKVLSPTRTPNVQRNLRRNKRDAVELTAKLGDQERAIETNSLNNNDIEFRRSDDCSATCPADGVMVCGRCHHGVFRTFMSACYLRLYQCKHPDDKLEMVAWRPCLESGPYQGELSRPIKGNEAPYNGTDPVFDFILARSSCDPKYQPMVKEILDTVKGIEAELDDIMQIIPNQRYNNERITYCITRSHKIKKLMLGEGVSKKNICPKDKGGQEMRKSTSKNPWTPHAF